MKIYFALLFIFLSVESKAFFFSSSGSSYQEWQRYIGNERSLNKKEKKQIKKEIKELEKNGYEVPSDKDNKIILDSFSSKRICDQLPQLSEPTKSLFMYDKTISEGLNKSLLPRKCLHKILREYLKSKFAAKSPLESKVCQKSNCTFAKEVVGIFDNNIQRLISIVYNKNAFKKYYPPLEKFLPYKVML